MLPPLSVGDATRSLLSPRKRSQARLRSTIAAPTATDADSATGSGSALVARLSLIPREFFVVERNAILPVAQYPPGVYQSSFSAGQWETIVFPALAPQTRQQVLYLRQTLEMLREALLRASDGHEPELDAAATATRASGRRHRIQHALVEYSKQEARIYSVCFHELIRQVQCICKEQSELLLEVRERYDTIIGRLAGRIQQLDEELSRRTERVHQLLSEAAELELASAALQQEDARKAARIADLKRLVLASRAADTANTDCAAKASEEDEEKAREAEWQRQRRQLASVDVVISAKKRRDSIAEENLAAARVQTAFHKYQMRKTQHALVLRVEKNVAALDIQRSYRGFRGRRRMLHHRAVVQAIMRRRKQVAAVELLQENVRAYLHKQRHSLAARRDTLAAPSSVVDATTASVDESTTAGAEGESISSQGVLASESNGEAGRETTAVAEASASRDVLHHVLMTSRELMAAATQLRSRSQRGGTDDEAHAESAADHAMAAINASETVHDASNVAGDESADSPAQAALPSDGDEAELLRRALDQTRSLVLSLEKVLASGRGDAGSSPDDSLGSSGSPDANAWTTANPPPARDVVSVSVSTSTSSLDNRVDPSSKEEESEVSAAQETDDTSPVSAPVLPVEPSAVRVDQGEGGDLGSLGRRSMVFRLDDSLWRSATYYAPPRQASDAEAQQRLLARVPSREQRKRLAQLKQFISDIYDTIVGRMRELPPRQVADAIKLHASLSLTCDEWQQQRRGVLPAVAGDPSPSRVLESAIPLDLDGMSREHFRCQFGLGALVDAAMQDLHEAVECFAPVDPDVEAFRALLRRERPYDELVFRCICRFLCVQGGSIPPGVKSATAPALPLPAAQAPRQPVFHPSTMREVLPVTSALEVARLLFRVDEQEDMVASDLRYVEVDNAVYRRYQPESGYQQCEEIVSAYLPAATDGAVPEPSWPRAPPSAVASPRAPMASLTRPTNCSQFHAKQYNSTAARSPLVRRQQQQQQQASCRLSASGPTGAGGGKWVYFEDWLALLRTYHAEMRHFHQFLQWAAELFALSAALEDSSPAAASSPRAVPFVSESAFSAALAPLSLSASVRELRSLFRNALRQRHLQLRMPLRTFTSVVLLLLEHRMISVSRFAPPSPQARRARAAGLGALWTAADSAADSAAAWRALAAQWRAREAALEAAAEALVRTDGQDALGRALRLLQLRDELRDLLAGRSAAGLLRGHEILEELLDELALLAGAEPASEARSLASEPADA